MTRLPLRVLEGRYVVCRLAPASPLPDPPAAAALWSVTRTSDELSVVCEEQVAPEADQVEGPFAALMVEGPLDFSLVGILASLSATLAERKVSIFALSTYDTDYVLVPVADLERSTQALEEAGHRVRAAR